MKSVWMVESGEYSAYNVDAIFETEDQAKEFVAAHGGQSYREFTLNTWTDESAIFKFKFDLSGNVIGESIDAYIEIRDYPEVSAHTAYRTEIEVTVRRGPRDRAIKIASELYTRIRASLDEAQRRTLVAIESGRLELGPVLNRDGRYQWTLALSVAEILAGIKPHPIDPMNGYAKFLTTILDVK